MLEMLDQTTDKDSGRSTAAFPVDFEHEVDTSVDIAHECVDGEAVSHDSGVVVVKRGPNAGSRFQLDQSVMSVGRNPDRDIFLDDATVSRRHAEFRTHDGKSELVDLDSLNGTYVNRTRLQSEAVLANGDEIQIGNFRLVFLAGPRTD